MRAGTRLAVRPPCTRVQRGRRQRDGGRGLGGPSWKLRPRRSPAGPCGPALAAGSGPRVCLSHHFLPQGCPAQRPFPAGLGLSSHYSPLSRCLSICGCSDLPGAFHVSSRCLCKENFTRNQGGSAVPGLGGCTSSLGRWPKSPALGRVHAVGAQPARTPHAPPFCLCLPPSSRNQTATLGRRAGPPHPLPGQRCFWDPERETGKSLQPSGQICGEMTSFHPETNRQEGRDLNGRGADKKRRRKASGPLPGNQQPHLLRSPFLTWSLQIATPRVPRTSASPGPFPPSTKDLIWPLGRQQ
ncbi:uncharacterized protein LOC118894454 isoform X2 [Balaenoptera musculus]|uniref:Uncharacterized protein LOC118894454 isoform X2 n=1 Tax=Balaenoptera musculus TaxID=9771 RepID=A0A8B8XFF2_BALMU|nr:uncharacterized protein LOC118894454 isoform X2 [Balaenoptera musculus]